jgi:hypothetical protein
MEEARMEGLGYVCRVQENHNFLRNDTNPTDDQPLANPFATQPVVGSVSYIQSELRKQQGIKRQRDENEAHNTEDMRARNTVYVDGHIAAKRIRDPPASGYYGVYASGKRWQVRVFAADGQRDVLGSFSTKEEAAFVYDRAARQCTYEEKPLNYKTLEEGEEAAEEAKRQPQAQPKARSASGFYGVTAAGKRWRAQIRHGGKKQNLGRFDTKEEAAVAYDSAVRQCGDEKKPLNYKTAEAAEEAVKQARQTPTSFISPVAEA